MGPRSDERGNCAVGAIDAGLGAASMGPRSDERGNKNSWASLRKKRNSFNGAALR